MCFFEGSHATSSSAQSIMANSHAQTLHLAQSAAGDQPHPESSEPSLKEPKHHVLFLSPVFSRTGGATSLTNFKPSHPPAWVSAHCPKVGQHVLRRAPEGALRRMERRRVPRTSRHLLSPPHSHIRIIKTLQISSVHFSQASSHVKPARMSTSPAAEQDEKVRHP